jgi:DNA-binding LacI/PurR family transcriptional regulator
MVSFDNSAESVYIPLSTIDFGLPRLGYLAAHIFINDIPVHADHEGNIAGLCTLVDQGSIGPASRHGGRGIRAMLRTGPSVRRPRKNRE